MRGASYPKPDAETVTRHQRQFGWTDLPAGGRKGKPPGLPRRPAGSGAWSSQTKTAWKALWSTPQATQWDATGVSLRRWAVAHEETVRAQAGDGRGITPLLGEMRQIEDRHGLNPKAMLQLRWRIIDSDADTVTQPARTTDDRKVVMLEKHRHA